MKKTRLLSVAFVSILSVMALAGCTGPSENTPKEPTKLEEVTNLNVARKDDKWEVTFNASEHASSYSLTIFNEEVKVKEESLTSTTYSMDPIRDTGNYVFTVKAIGDETNYTSSEGADFTYKVYVYDNEVINNVTRSGVSEQDKPVGTFTLVYAGGATYVGTLTDDFLRKDGKLQYTNNNYYEGHFENDQFSGEGLFTWSMTDDWHDGNTYQGNFINGGFNDQVGTYYTAANWTRPIDYSGIYNWTGVHGSEFGVCGKVGEVGKGEFQYGNNSIYSGDLKVIGKWQYARHGFGYNKWIVIEHGSWITGGSDTKVIDGFEGQFVETGWIDGDGIWYFKDSDGNPESYIKGKWVGGERKGDATSELKVREEYANATEIKL